MELTSEERRKIYEEEKARIEAREELERERKKPSPDTGTSLVPNVAGLLCYLGVWVTGIIFIVLEQKNRWVRFHAAQSIVVFASLLIIGSVLGLIPVIGTVFSTILGIIGFILWIVLMVKAYQGEYYKVPVAGDIAEMIVSGTTTTTGSSSSPQAPDKAATGEGTEPAATPADLGKRIETKVDDFFERSRGGRITGAIFAIAFCIVFLVFFNVFHDYIAFYQADTQGGIATWERYPFFTAEVSQWLVYLNAALVVAIIGNFLLIFLDNKALRQIARIVMDAFGLVAVVMLLTIFPFDFYVIPSAAAAAGTQIGITVVLAFLVIVMSITVLVRIIRLIVELLKGAAGTGKAA